MKEVYIILDKVYHIVFECTNECLANTKFDEFRSRGNDVILISEEKNGDTTYQVLLCDGNDRTEVTKGTWKPECPDFDEYLGCCKLGDMKICRESTCPKENKTC
jgi:hypothetical protein